MSKRQRTVPQINATIVSSGSFLSSCKHCSVVAFSLNLWQVKLRATWFSVAAREFSEYSSSEWVWDKMGKNLRCGEKYKMHEKNTGDSYKSLFRKKVCIQWCKSILFYFFVKSVWNTSLVFRNPTNFYSHLKCQHEVQYDAIWWSHTRQVIWNWPSPNNTDIYNGMCTINI